MENKVYARQIAPEMQGDFDVFDYDEVYNEITVFGNRDYSGRKTKVFERVYNTLQSKDLKIEIERIKSEYSYYTNVTEAINDYLYREDGKRYSCKDIHDLKELVIEYSTCPTSEEDEILCKVLSLVTRKTYNHRTIRGYCQSEWQEVYYPIDEYDYKDIKNFETLYFNLGTEWEIHDGEDTPETAEDINGYCMYCLASDIDSIKKEIAEATGVTTENVILYICQKCTYIAYNYEIA